MWYKICIFWYHLITNNYCTNGFVMHLTFQQNSTSISLIISQLGFTEKKTRHHTPEIMQTLLGKSQLSERHYPLLAPGKWRSTYAWAQTCLPRHYSRRPSAKCWQTKNKWLVALEFGIGRWQSHNVWVRYFGFEDKLLKKTDVIIVRAIWECIVWIS